MGRILLDQKNIKKISVKFSLSEPIKKELL